MKTIIVKNGFAKGNYKIVKKKIDKEGNEVPIEREEEFYLESIGESRVTLVNVESVEIKEYKGEVRVE